MDALTLSWLLVAMVVGIGIIELVIRRSDVGAGFVLVMLLLDVTDFADLTIRAGPVNIFPRDLVFVVLMTAATARLIRASRTTTAQRFIIAFGALVIWSIVRGADVAGLPAAVNEGRASLVVAATALYFSTVHPERELFDRIGRLWLFAAAALCALTFARWGANAVGITGGIFGDGGGIRVIGAASTLILGQAAMIGVPALRDVDGGLRRLTTPVLLAFVVLLQHRTVWIVVAVGMAYLLLSERALTPRVLAALGASLVLLATLSVTVLDAGEETVADQLSNSATATGTFEWRLAGWQALLTDSGPESGVETLAGKPFGSGWDRMVDGFLIEVSPHNYYVEAFLRVGVLGIAAFLALYVVALRRIRDPVRRHIDVGGLLSRNVLGTIVAVQLLFYIPYSPDSAQALLLGLGCAAASLRSSRKAGTREPSLEVTT